MFTCCVYLLCVLVVCTCCVYLVCLLFVLIDDVQLSARAMMEVRQSGIFAPSEALAIGKAYGCPAHAWQVWLCVYVRTLLC